MTTLQALSSATCLRNPLTLGAASNAPEPSRSLITSSGESTLAGQTTLAGQATSLGHTTSPGESTSGQSTAPNRQAFQLPDLWPLVHGGSLPQGHLVYEISGPPHGPVIVVLGGISSGAHVTSTPDDSQPGWWQDLVGKGRAIDTTRFRILSFDFLGGNGGSTGPRHGASDPPNHDPFPSVDTADQARVLALLLDELGIGCLAAIVGSSYGGMVGLAFAERYPKRVEQAIVISAADRAHPQSTAWRSVQRRTVRLGLEYGAEREGLSLARALAMVTYRSPKEFEQRFSGQAEARDGAFRFPIENYLDARGADFADRFDPRAFLCLSESIDLHRVEPERIVVPTTLVAARSDQLVPVEQLRSLARLLAGPCDLIEIDSLYGHDAFLKETDTLTTILRDRLAN